MANFAYGRESRTQGEVVDRVFVGGQEAGFIFGQGTQIFPNTPVDIYGTTQARIVEDSGKKWFELGFRMDHLLSGNPAAGWTDAGNYFRIDYEWSDDLSTWSAGKFVAAPTPIIDLMDGTWEYWARCINPQDAAIKTANLVCSSSAATGDSRNNPLTEIKIAGATQSLPNLPYTMPGDAAQLQTDLIAAGWAGASVTATSNLIWEIAIPNVTTSTFNATSYVAWPSYTISTPLGPSVVNGRGFEGIYVDADGNVIHTKAFGRLKITKGTRYAGL